MKDIQKVWMILMEDKEESEYWKEWFKPCFTEKRYITNLMCASIICRNDDYKESKDNYLKQFEEQSQEF